MLSIILTYILFFIFYTITSTINVFFCTVKASQIEASNQWLESRMPKNLRIYNEENRFGIFTLLYLNSCVASLFLIYIITWASLEIARCVSNLIGLFLYLFFVSINPLTYSTIPKWYKHKDVREHETGLKDQGCALNELIQEIEDFGISQHALPVFLTMKKAIIFFSHFTSYVLTLVPRLLLNFVNTIDKYIFSTAFLNQDLYWLLIERGNKNTNGFTPLRRAIRNKNMRAMKILANDRYTAINETIDNTTLLDYAISHSFNEGIEIILSHRAYVLSAYYNYLAKVLSSLIKSRNETVLSLVLNHKQTAYHSGITHLQECINRKFTAGITMLINKCYQLSETKPEKRNFNFLLPFITRKNYESLKPALESMNPNMKAEFCTLLDDQKIPDDLRVKYQASLQDHIDYQALARATGLPVEEFKQLCESEVMDSHIKNYDGICPISTDPIKIPVKIKTECEEERQFYEYSMLQRVIKTNNISPCTKGNIISSRIAVQEYSDILIMAFLSYAIQEGKGDMIKKIEHTTYELSDENETAIKDMISKYRTIQNSGNKLCATLTNLGQRRRETEGLKGHGLDSSLETEKRKLEKEIERHEKVLESTGMRETERDKDKSLKEAQDILREINETIQKTKHDKQVCEPLISAILKEDKEAVRTLLLQDESTIIVTDSMGKTPLILAAERNLTEIATLIIQSSDQFGINQIDHTGNTALSYALNNNNSTLTDNLLNRQDAISLRP